MLRVEISDTSMGMRDKMAVCGHIVFVAQAMLAFVNVIAAKCENVSMPMDHKVSYLWTM